jgi:hypothetical protein
MRGDSRGAKVIRQVRAPSKRRAPASSDCLLKETSNGEIWQQAAAYLLMVHGGAAMLTLMLLGALFPVHIGRQEKPRHRRRHAHVQCGAHGDRLRALLSRLGNLETFTSPSASPCLCFFWRISRPGVSAPRQVVRFISSFYRMKVSGVRNSPESCAGLQRAAPRIAGLFPKFLLDPDQLIIFREPIRARERTGFDLAAIGCNS